MFDNKYVITVNARTDGSSKLGANHKWGFFPSASAAWIISNEEFMKKQKIRFYAALLCSSMVFSLVSTPVSAAETGHLVFSTLHTIGAAPTIERIIDVFPPHQQNQIRSQLASVLEAVISQQLLPTIDGKSRVAAFEVMLGTPAIKNLIREDKAHQIPSIMQTSKKIGMQTMDDSLFSLYLKHKIDAANAVEYAQDTGNMQQKLF